MTHLKRQNAPKSWPIPRKGTTFVVRPNFGFSKGIPLLIILRDMLKIAENKKEVKKAIYMKKKEFSYLIHSILFQQKSITELFYHKKGNLI